MQLFMVIKSLDPNPDPEQDPHWNQCRNTTLLYVRTYITDSKPKVGTYNDKKGQDSSPSCFKSYHKNNKDEILRTVYETRNWQHKII
jgi:hypothetical protein